MMKRLIALLAVLTLQNPSFAQNTEVPVSAANTANSSNPELDIDLLIHGIIVDKDLFTYRLQVATQNGQPDSKELRLAIREELFQRALLLEQAKRQGYTKDRGIKLMAQEAQENVYIDFALQDYLKNHPITDELLKAEYDQQIKLIGPKGLIVEYHLATIAVENEENAKELIAKTKKENFAKLAADYSIDPSAKQGGDLGWINLGQMQPAMRAIIANISKGSVTAAPIQIGKAWHVIKVLDRREGRPASFSESKERLKPAVIQKLKNDYVEELKQTRIKERSAP